MASDGFRLLTAGDSSLIVEFERRVDPAINARALSLGTAVRARALDGVRDVVTAYHTVAVYFDPLRTRLEELIECLESCAAASGREVPAEPEPVHVPVCYGGEFGPDLAEVANFAGCSEQEVIETHSAATYRVYMLGFIPGFTYMGSLDPRIAMPRRATPRLRVPAGSIGIASRQTGIYPAETPGGWRLVGRTPLRPFDMARDTPFLFQPGDQIRFVPIPPARYAELASVGSGSGP
jgi:KipI family sensor histidine kinase inhibitor